MGSLWVLREWPQLAVAAIALPYAIEGKLYEHSFRVGHFSRNESAFFVVLAAAYLTDRSGHFNLQERRALRWIGGLLFVPYAMSVIGTNYYEEALPTRAVYGLGGLLFASIFGLTLRWELLAVVLWTVIPDRWRALDLGGLAYLFLLIGMLLAWMRRSKEVL